MWNVRQYLLGQWEHLTVAPEKHSPAKRKRLAPSDPQCRRTALARLCVEEEGKRAKDGELSGPLPEKKCRSPAAAWRITPPVQH